MQSTSKDYLPGYGRKERENSNAVKAKDRGNGGTAAAEFVIATPEISKSCS